MQPHEHIILEISRERERQQSKEGWSPEHDDSHDNRELALAAACYAIGRPDVGGNVTAPCGVDGQISATMSIRVFPWIMSWWKPKTERRNLIRAAALIVAEIERLDRAHARSRAA